MAADQTEPSAQSVTPSEDAEAPLPATYDQLVSIDQLVHGKHNPRRVSPSDQLRRSVANEGLQHPLIVHMPDSDEKYHITDGWQRYQAAVSAGWTQLPVQIYPTAEAALKAAERTSMGREWTTYHWAQYCQSLAVEIADEDADNATERNIAERVARRTDHARNPRTIQMYIKALELPEEIHPLLTEGPEGSDQDWYALQNFNQRVRQFGSLHWQVGEMLARRRDGLSDQRTIGIAAMAVKYDTQTLARKFVSEATEADPNIPLETIYEKVLFGDEEQHYLKAPSVTLRVSPETKHDVMDYCSEQQVALSNLVEEALKEVVRKVSENK